METVEESFSTDDLMIHPQVPSRVPQPREKSKRPQLSCNPCRARKVKVGTALSKILLLFLLKNW